MLASAGVSCFILAPNNINNMLKTINVAYNILQLLLWSVMLVGLLVYNFMREEDCPVDISALLFYLRVIQTSQGFDLVLNLLG